MKKLPFLLIPLLFMGGCAGGLVRDIALQDDRVAALDAKNQEKLIQRIEFYQAQLAEATLLGQFGQFRRKLLTIKDPQLQAKEWTAFYQSIGTHVVARLTENNELIEARARIKENLATRRHLWTQAVKAANAIGEEDVVELRLNRMENILTTLIGTLNKKETP
jgi:hypothetical protein